MKIVSRAVAVGTAGVLALTLATPASAVSWASSSNPIFAAKDNYVRVEGYGYFYNQGYVSARTDAYIRKMYQYNTNGVYGWITNYDWYEGGDWDSMGEDETNRITSSSWTLQIETNPLLTGYSKVRARIMVCEDIAWSFDPCSDGSGDSSDPAVPSFNY